jgi:hypothetical protein
VNAAATVIEIPGLRAEYGLDVDTDAEILLGHTISAAVIDGCIDSVPLIAITCVTNVVAARAFPDAFAANDAESLVSITEYPSVRSTTDI